MSAPTAFDLAWESPGPARLRDLIASEASHAALVGQVAGLLCPGLPGGSAVELTLRRATIKRDRGLRAAFRMRLRQPGGGSDDTRPVSVAWWSAASRDGRAGDASAAGQAAFPFCRLADADPVSGRGVQVWPHDPAFPQLPALADPAGIGLAGFRVIPVRYVPGNAHVVRFDPPDSPGAGEGSIFAKVFRDTGEADRRREAIGAASKALEGLPGVIPLDVLPGTAAGGVLLFPFAAGASLAAHIRSSAPGTASSLRVLAAAAAALHAAAPPPGLRQRPLEVEVAAAAYAGWHLGRLLPEAAADFERLLGVAAGAAGTVAEEAVLAHGDFKAEHARAQSGRITLIDLDSAAAAEPALDLGRLLADLRWELRGDPRARSAAQACFLDGYRSAGGLTGARELRARVFELVFFLRAVVRRTAFWNPGWEAGVTAGLAAAGELALQLS